MIHNINRWEGLDLYTAVNQRVYVGSLCVVREPKKVANVKVHLTLKGRRVYNHYYAHALSKFGCGQALGF